MYAWGPTQKSMIKSPYSVTEMVLVVFRPAHYTNCSSIVLIIMCSAVISF